MKLNREEVLHIARLARVGLSEEEVKALSRQLSEILEHFTVLQQVNTKNVSPTTGAFSAVSVMKDDKTKKSIPQKDVLANAPKTDGNFIRVRAVLE